jgi:hypothetical protein
MTTSFDFPSLYSPFTSSGSSLSFPSSSSTIHSHLTSAYHYHNPNQFQPLPIDINNVSVLEKMPMSQDKRVYNHDKSPQLVFNPNLSDPVSLPPHLHGNMIINIDETSSKQNSNSSSPVPDDQYIDITKKHMNEKTTEVEESKHDGSMGK